MGPIAVADHGVAEEERAVPGEPERCFVHVVHRDRLDPARKLVAIFEGVRERDAVTHTTPSGLVRPESRAVVALEDLWRAAHVPVDADQDRGRPVVGDVAVERLPERLRLVSWHERVEEDERLILDERVRRDLLLPLGMVRAPPPEPRRDLLHVYENVALRDRLPGRPPTLCLRAYDGALPGFRS